MAETEGDRASMTVIDLRVSTATDLVLIGIDLQGSTVIGQGLTAIGARDLIAIEVQASTEARTLAIVLEVEALIEIEEEIQGGVGMTKVFSC